MTDSKTPAPLSPPPSSIQGRVPTQVFSQAPTAQSQMTSAVPPARPPVGAPPAPVAPPAGRPPGVSPGLPPAAPPPPAGRLPTPPQPVTPAAPPLAKAELKQSPLRFLPFILGGILLIGLAIFIFRFFFANKTPAVTTGPGTTGTNTPASVLPAQTVTLTYWGLWEPTPILQEVLSDFESSHPGIKVSYQMQSYQDYRDRVQSSIASNRGPDVFRFHASWTPMLQNELSPMPDTVYTSTEFQQIFYPAATQLLTLNGKIYGVPLMYEGLALLYNEDALRAANLQPPQTWADLKDDATRLTIRSGNTIQRAGLAIGNASNVDHFSDILALLILQNGGNLYDPTSQNGSDALTFYTNFMKNDQVWNESFPNSTTAFARGDVAMIFAPSWRIHEIQNMNPNLKFGVVPVPQLTSNKVTWASFWAEGVSAQSKYKTESWTLLKYLSSPDVLRKLYSSASKDRAFGEIYPRRDMAADLGSQPLVSPYLLDAPYALGGYMSSATHDNGLDDQIIKYYQDAVNAQLGSSTLTPTEILTTVQAGVSQVLRQYNVPGAPAAPAVTQTTSQ